MSFQPATATESPNHWWASSWTTVEVFRLPGEYVGRVWFSSAKPGSRLVARPPVVEKGYGAPSTSSIHAVYCADFLSSDSARSRRSGSRPFETPTYQGWPCDVPCATANLPAAKNARYGTIGSAGSQVVVASPPCTFRATRSPLAITCLPF